MSRLPRKLRRVPPIAAVLLLAVAISFSIGATRIGGVGGSVDDGAGVPSPLSAALPQAEAEQRVAGTSLAPLVKRTVNGTEGDAVPLDAGPLADPRGEWTITGDQDGACTTSDPDAALTTLTCVDNGRFTASYPTVAGYSVAITLDLANAAPDPESQMNKNAYTGVPLLVRTETGDPGSNDTFVCTVEWGDHTSSRAFGAGGLCINDHVYLRGGDFTPRLTLRDDDGAKVSTPIHRLHTVYRPAAASVSGAIVNGSTAGSITSTASVDQDGYHGFVRARLAGSELVASTPAHVSLNSFGQLDFISWTGLGTYAGSPKVRYYVNAVLTEGRISRVTLSLLTKDGTYLSASGRAPAVSGTVTIG